MKNKITGFKKRVGRGKISIETRKRTLAKTISWRVLGGLITALIIFFITGELALSLGLGSLDTVVKLFIYYAHERGWSKIKWGINKNWM